MNTLTNIFPFEICVYIYDIIYKSDYDKVMKDVCKIEYIVSNNTISYRRNSPLENFVQYFLDTWDISKEKFISKNFTHLYCDKLTIYNSKPYRKTILTKNKNNSTIITCQ